MRILAVGLLALTTLLCILCAMIAALAVLWAWPRFFEEPENLFAAGLSLVTVLLLGLAAGRAVVRHVRPRRSSPYWWEVALAGLAFAAGVPLIARGLDPSEFDAVLFQFIGTAFLLSAFMLLLKPQPRDRAS